MIFALLLGANPTDSEFAAFIATVASDFIHTFELQLTEFIYKFYNLRRGVRVSVLFIMLDVQLYGDDISTIVYIINCSLILFVRALRAANVDVVFIFTTRSNLATIKQLLPVTISKHSEFLSASSPFSA